MKAERAKELMTLGIPAPPGEWSLDDVVGTRIPWSPLENFIFWSWRHLWRYLGFGVPDWRWLNRWALRRMDRWYKARREEPNQWEIWSDGDRLHVFDSYDEVERWLNGNGPELTASSSTSWSLGARISGSLYRIHGYDRYGR
jgi:hypothetical protein